MKTVLAENRFILTKTLFYEGMRRVSAASYGKTVKKLLIGVALLWLALSVWTVRRSGSVSYALMELAVLAAVSLWLAVLLPRGRARRAWKTMEDNGSAEAERITEFFDGHLEVNTGLRTVSLAYGEIAEILHTDSLLLLISREKTGIMLKKDAFTRGTEETVLQLIEEAQKEDATHD